MISKISLFNKGIYKSTIKRYLWGSVLYFILLFMMTGMSIMLSYDRSIQFLPQRGLNWSLIMDNEYILLPMLLAFAVPTVAGLMVFRFIHSKKTSVFVHSLPVKREANYVSSVLAALTLMAAPVILNTLVLMLISVTGYSQYFGIGDCAVWMLFNLLALFIMFSCVCFVASITGNSFAMIALNVLFHSFVPLLAAGFSIVSEKFLFGYAGEDVLLSRVVDNNFPVRLISFISRWSSREQGFNEAGTVVKFIMIALLLYVISAILYKKRRMETAEDVAGFKCLNPIFKYLLTFMGAIAAFSIFSYSMQDNQFMFWCIVALSSIVIYFAGEMLLKKTFRVWHTYKGYLGFAIAFAAMMCVFAFTGFFGFENYVPKEGDVSEIALYNYYSGEKPFSENKDIINKALIIHKNRLIEKDIIKSYTDDTNIHIEYQLKNGKTVHRRYGVSQDELHRIMQTMYKNQEYKELSERIYTDISSVYTINIYADEHIDINDEEKKQELFECLKKDISSLSYNEIHNDAWGFNIDIEYVPQKVFNEDNYRIVTSQSGERERIYMEYMSVWVNANFKNTIAWFVENGYWEKLAIKNEGFMYICGAHEELPFLDGNEFTGVISQVKENKIVKLDTPQDMEKIINYAQFEKQTYVEEKDRCEVYQVTNLENQDYHRITTLSKQVAQSLFPEKSVYMTK